MLSEGKFLSRGQKTDARADDIPNHVFGVYAVMRNAVIGTVLLALLLGVAAFWMVEKDRRNYERDNRSWEMSGTRKKRGVSPGILSLQEILQRLDLPRGTRVLEVEREYHDGDMYYEIEMVTAEGRVLELYVDPYTAEIVKQEEDD